MLTVEQIAAEVGVTVDEWRAIHRKMVADGYLVEGETFFTVKPPDERN